MKQCIGDMSPNIVPCPCPCLPILPFHGPKPQPMPLPPKSSLGAGALVGAVDDESIGVHDEPGREGGERG